ncbi:MAG TPA: hypothetical protein VJP45_10645 [Candidatus Limnocylindria bacterium]|nr:hypothetical protein [Candidatus Limnocylindria bacterium]
MHLASTLEGTPCSTTIGDGPAGPQDPKIVRATPPVAIRVDTDPGADVRGWIYDIDAPTPSRGPLEEFTLLGSGEYRSRSIVAARTYEVMVHVERSLLGFRNRVTHVFRMRVQPP